MNERSARPVNVNVFQYRFPLPAIISILHRISGILIFLFTPLMLYLLHRSLLSRPSFLLLKQTLQMPMMKLGIWIMLAAIIFHLLAGIRHMIMDLGYAEGLKAARATAYIILSVSIVMTILVGVWLW